ncbi:hypothetical protein ACGFIF_43740 [Kribbella sp. NPDC049174]|uniref:hypothetical protein n=1 Tax=Kribbella sp. NPDC049174 TaxID=3364112 RepID=UPI003715002F
MTEHPGEQFPPDVDPDVEPGFDPYPPEETPHTPDYDTEPENFSREGEVERAYGEPVAAEADSHGAPAVHVDPAEVEFGPEFARAPGEEHEHPYAAESAVAEQAVDEQVVDDPEPAEDAVPEYPGAEEVPEDERAHPLVEETMGRLDELRDRSVGEHAEVYADLHERLQSALVEADADPGDRS